MLFIPLITRIYSPENFGTLQLFISVSSIIAIISCFSYQIAIMLPANDEDSVNIFVLCIILILFTSAFIGIISIIFAGKISYYFKDNYISNYLILLPISIFLSGLDLVMSYWLSRRIKFGVITISRMSNVISSKLAQIGFGVGGISSCGLILGQVVGIAISNMFMAYYIKNEASLFNRVSMKSILVLALKYKNYPLFSSWSAIANSISTQVPSFMLAFFYSTTVVGHYSLANMVINMPMAILGSAIGPVFFQKISEEKNKDESVKQIVYETYKKLVSIGILPMIIMMIISEDLFSFVFGTNWTISGTYSRILIPWIFLVFISSPLSTIFDVFEKQAVGLYFNLTLLLSRVLALYVGGTYGSPIFTLTLFGFTGVVFWGWMNYYLLKISGISYKESVEILIKYMVLSITASIPLVICKYFLLSQYIIFFVAGVTTLIYILIIIHKDLTLKIELQKLIKGAKI